jgi:drug/metabolite transporter (DMT)-like permease
MQTQKAKTQRNKLLVTDNHDFEVSEVCLSHHWGYVAAIVSAVLFGVSSTLNKIALENVNPTVIAGMIYFVAGVFLFGLHLSPLCSRKSKI